MLREFKIPHECRIVSAHRTPRWMAERGGWAEPEIVDKFVRFCEKSVAHLGDLIALGCTINEPNAVSMVGYLMERFPPGLRDFSLYTKASEHLRDAHARAYDVLKAGAAEGIIVKQ